MYICVEPSDADKLVQSLHQALTSGVQVHGLLNVLVVELRDLQLKSACLGAGAEISYGSDFIFGCVLFTTDTQHPTFGCSIDILCSGHPTASRKQHIARNSTI